MAALAKLSDLKALLNIRPNNSTLDGKAKLALAMATSMIENQTRRHFAEKTFQVFVASADTCRTETDLAGFSDNGLAVRIDPQLVGLEGLRVVRDSLDVRYDHTLRFDENKQVPDEALTLLDGDHHTTLSIYFAMRRKSRALRIRYTAGYAVIDQDDDPYLDAPADLRSACLLQACHLWNRIDPNSVGVETDDDAKGAKFVVKGGLIPDVVALTLPYRRTFVR